MRATDKQRGFTLLEIMVVIVIIGVLASVLIHEKYEKDREDIGLFGIQRD